MYNPDVSHLQFHDGALRSLCSSKINLILIHNINNVSSNY